MSVMPDIVEFLTARLDEDEAGANATTPPSVYSRWRSSRWRASRDKGATPYAPLHLVQIAHEDDDGTEYNSSSPVIAFNTLPQEFAVPNIRHIARHDPARVLAEVKAKRALIEHWRTYAEQHRRDDCDPEAGAAWAALSYILVSFAGVHRSHPDYAGDDIGDWTWPDDDPAWRADA